MQVCLQVYVVGSHEALAHYLKAFGGELGLHGMNADGTYMHAEVVKDGQTIIMLSESREWSAAGMNMQYCVNFGKEHRAELEAAYNVLSEGGRVLYPLGRCPWNECMADVVDRFGVRWYIAL